MATGPVIIYYSAVNDFYNGAQDWDTNPHYVALLTSSYTPNLNHSTWADVSTYEVVDASYIAQNMTGATVTLDGDRSIMDAADVNFGSNVTVTCRYLVIVVGVSGSKSGTDRLVGYQLLDDDPADIVVTAQPLIVQWDSVNGIFESSSRMADVVETLGAINPGNLRTGVSASVPAANFTRITSMAPNATGYVVPATITTTAYDYTDPPGGIILRGWT